MHRTRLQTLLALALSSLLLALCAGPASAQSACAGADTVPASANLDQMRTATLCLINVERTTRGLKALSTNNALTGAAQSYSWLMVREGFFDHVSPGGSTLLGRVRGATAYLSKARSYSLGENIAWGSGDLATPRETLVAWMHSAGHRRNILDRRFRHIGVGVATGAPVDTQGLQAATYTTDFGRRSR